MGNKRFITRLTYKYINHKKAIEKTSYIQLLQTERQERQHGEKRKSSTPSQSVGMSGRGRGGGGGGGGGRRRDERGGRGGRKRPPRGDKDRDQAGGSSPTKDVHFKIIKNVEREKQEQQKQLDQEFPGMYNTYVDVRGS